ncbi:uncharacterized protein BDV17DRAFT_287993 [Aspergillus undulatus]|uniref:uncharacterized protein n=1 Tax=Aspergillus undulatus TaxID=1810928 RepID=UPI003CCD2357
MGIQRDEYAEILISGQGVLCHPSWSSIPGLQDFQGKLAHSAQWDHDFDYTHKRIAVIGNGSSGIQITPQMANSSKGPNNEEAVRFGTEQMASNLNYDPDLCRKLIPDREVGCLRVTPGPGYLESFSKQNCTLSNSPIIQITPNAVHTANGKVFECDVVICATGFDVSYRPKFPLIGLNGTNLAGKWADEPESYLSVDMGVLSKHSTVNWTGDYFVKWIKKIATEDIMSVVPKKSAEEAFVRYSDEMHKTLSWTAGCKSWYKRNKEGGRITALFGGANQPRFLGNGFLEYEMDPEEDLACLDGLGFNALQIVHRHIGARVLVSDIRSQKFDAARAIGVPEADIVRPGDYVNKFIEERGIKIDTAPNPVGSGQTFADAQRIVRPGGKKLLIGTGDRVNELDMKNEIRKRLSVLFSYGGQKQDLEEALDLIGPGVGGCWSLGLSWDALRSFLDSRSSWGNED